MWCAAEVGLSSVREAVTARVRTIRAVPEQHRMITLATSEMARSAYRSIESADQMRAGPMATDVAGAAGA